MSGTASTHSYYSEHDWQRLDGKAVGNGPVSGVKRRSYAEKSVCIVSASSALSWRTCADVGWGLSAIRIRRDAAVRHRSRWRTAIRSCCTTIGRRTGGTATRTCVLIHGLAGSHASGYMRRMAAEVADRGVRVFRMDMRGCGAGEELARGTTHCGRWADAAAAV